MSNNCIFCQIVTGQSDSWKIFEGQDTYAFLDTAPITPGHILIIPKKHYSCWTQTPEMIMHKIIKTIPQVTKIIDQKLSPGGYNFVSNQGKIAQQVVMHFHIHIIPRYAHPVPTKKAINLAQVHQKLINN